MLRAIHFALWAAAAIAGARENPPPEPAEHQRVIRATGVVQAVRGITVQVPQIAGQSGRLTLTRICPNGARIAEGDVVAEFDRTQTSDEARNLQAKFEDLQHQIEHKKAQNRSETAKRLQERREAEAELARAALQLRKGPVLSEIDRQKAEVRHKAALRNLESLSKSHVLREKSEAAALRVVELQSERQKVGLDRANSSLERLLVRAPIGGMAALDNIWRSGTIGPAQEGDQVYAGQAILRIFDPAHMVVLASVNQADGAALREGTIARIRLDAYPDVIFRGHLEFSSPVASSALNTPIRTFPARFRLDSADPRLLPDLAAAVEVVVP